MMTRKTTRASQPKNRSHEARRIVRRLTTFALVASLAFVAFGLVGTSIVSNDTASSELRLQIVQLNTTRANLAASIEQASATNADTAALREADADLARAQESLRLAADAQTSLPTIIIWIICVAASLAIVAETVFLYLSVIRPFMRLEAFADEVALGNLDLPLAYERSNPFGRFTWAFDNMRKEVKRARAAEAEAIEQNKTTIAALSHDIKTPVASIRAYSEALELGIARTDEERADYSRTIMRKCDEVTALTDDLFLHAIADLDRIEVSVIPISIDATIRQAITDFDAADTICITRLEAATLPHDPKRLMQVLENLIANARKYAPGARIEVSGAQKGATYRIEVRDFGPGMPPADMPFALNRFYRGSNAGQEPGAGLGLFIVKYLVEQMAGTIRIENAEPGFKLIITFPMSS